MKNWKSLFVKTEDTATEKTNEPESLSFPVGNSNPAPKQPAENFAAHAITDPTVTEVLQVYESGLESINMPGYDFYEFYRSVSSFGVAGEQTYLMAYQMAKTLDKTITTHKLLQDAEFYISKIGEVHGQYVSQGQGKLNAIEEQKRSEKSKLTSEIDQGTLRLTQLRAELQQLETDLNHKKTLLTRIDDTYYPKEKVIKEKLNANDLARKTSIDKLNMIKEGIHRFIK